MTLRNLISFVLLVTMWMACKKELAYNQPPSAVSLYDIAFEDNVNFSLLRAAVIRAGWKDSLSGPGSYTFFAPQNQAFSDAGYSLAAIENATPASMDSILKNHLVAGNVELRTLEDGTQLTALSNEKLKLRNIGDTTFYVNGSDVMKNGIKATNGVMHIVNKLFRPARFNLAGFIAEQSNMTFLTAAFSRANMSALLSGTEAYTLFAPTDAAFIASGKYVTIDEINNETPEVLANVLKYHLLQGRKLTSDFDSMAVTTEAQLPVYMKRIKTGISSGVYSNGLSLARGGANIQTTNGLVHIVSRVLAPPLNMNTLHAITADPDLTFLSAAVTRAGSNFSGLLSGEAPYTLYAPANAAFQAAGFVSIDAINAADPSVMAALVKYHIVKERVHSGSYANNAGLNTLLEERNADGVLVQVPITITVNAISGLYQVKGRSNTSSSTVNPGDVVTTNGTYNVIGQVLKPL